MRLLDLFCGAGGAGGAAMGYHRAGFEVVGVDVKPQSNYPFEFWKGDALRLMREWFGEAPPYTTQGDFDFDAIHASPPCQAYTNAQKIQQYSHPDLIGPTRELLEQTGLPYVIENVPGAPLRNPVVLEGQMFELGTRRPRWFETNWPLQVGLCPPPHAPTTKMGRPPKEGEFMHVVGNFSDVEAGRKAMGIDWMTRDELREAIPPAYTEFIGHQLMSYLMAEVA